MNPARIGHYVRNDGVQMEGQIKDIKGTHLTVMTEEHQFFGMELQDVKPIERPDYWHDNLDAVEIVR